MIFLVSDNHFGHKNVMEYEDRPFEDLDHMEEQMILRWNKVVGKNDTVWHLGDVSFFSKQKTQGILGQLRGQKHLILGNHDRDHSLKWWRDAGFDTAIKYPIIVEDKYILSHEPFGLGDTPFLNVHGHIHSKKPHWAREDIRHFNVSVDVLDFAPISLDAIKEAFDRRLTNAQ